MRRPLPLLCLLALAACDLGPDYTRPAIEVPEAYRATDATAAAAWPEPQWWQGFRSPELNDLIAQARVANFDLLAAIARVRQADAQVRISGAPLLPSLTFSPSAQYQRNALGSSGSFQGVSFGNKQIENHIYSAEFNASYQVDFWGQNAATYASAQASLLASKFDQETVALTVVTSVADTWFQALSLQDRLAIAQQNLRTSENVLGAIRGRLTVGTATALDLSQQLALVQGLRANIPHLTSQRAKQVIALGILIGRPPEAVNVTPGTLNTLALPPVGAGLPSDLLLRRPDVANAEAQLVAQNANIKAARAAFFPQVQLTGSGGLSSIAVNTLFFGPGSTVAALAATATQTIFDNGLKQGQIEQARGKYDELVANYRKAVVQAFTDVEDALTALRYTTEQEALEAQAVATAQQSVDIAGAQLAAGTIDVTTVLQAQQTLFTDRDTLAQVRLARFQALVSLYKALGGGWTLPPQDAGEMTK